MQGIFPFGSGEIRQGQQENINNASNDPELQAAINSRLITLHYAGIKKENAITRYQDDEQRVETVVREHLDHKTMMDDLARTPHTLGPSLPPKMVYIDQDPANDTLVSVDPADLARERINQAVAGVEPAAIQINPDISLNPSVDHAQRTDSVQRSI